MNFTVFLAVLVGIIFPTYILLTYKRVNENIKKNEKYRLLDYKQMIFIFWVLTILVLANYFLYNQPTLNLYPKFSIINIGLAILILAFVYFYRHKSRNFRL